MLYFWLDSNFSNHLCKASYFLHTMERRQLPRRNARVLATASIYNVSVPEDDDIFEEVLEDDDYINEILDPLADNNVEGDADSDGVLDEEHVMLQSSDESSDDEETITGLVSQSGKVWTDQRNVEGRQPVQNVFRGRQGFRLGLHPQSRKEGFLVLFDEIIDSVVRFTNLQGRRLSHRLGIQWHATDLIEILAFIGLHLFSGNYFLF